MLSITFNLSASFCQERQAYSVQNMEVKLSLRVEAANVKCALRQPTNYRLLQFSFLNFMCVVCLLRCQVH